MAGRSFIVKAETDDDQPDLGDSESVYELLEESRVGRARLIVAAGEYHNPLGVLSVEVTIELDEGFPQSLVESGIPSIGHIQGLELIA